MNVWNWIVCTFTEDSEAVIAIGTIWLALVTTGLTLFTAYLWNATASLVSLENPRVIIKRIIFDHTKHETWKQGEPSGIYTRIQTIVADVINCGKSPAVMISIGIKIIPSVSDPHSARKLFTFQESELIKLSYSILPDESMEHDMQCPLGQSDNLPDSFLLAIEVIYEDIAGRSHFSRECRFLDRGGVRVSRHGGRKYNYYK